MKFSYNPGLVKRSSSVKIEVTTLSTSHLPPNGFIVSQISLSVSTTEPRNLSTSSYVKKTLQKVLSTLYSKIWPLILI
jgi:hypothetical protein